MKPPISQPRPASRVLSFFRALRRVSGYASDLKIPQQTISRSRKPTRMARLQRHTTLMQLPHCAEELACYTLVELKLGRKLHQHRAQLLSQTGH